MPTMALPNVEDALRSLVREIVRAAERVAMTELPRADYSYSWWECTSPNAKESRTATESEPTFRHFFSALFPGIDEHDGPPEFVALSAATKDFEKSIPVRHVIFASSAWKLMYDYFVNEMASRLAYDDTAIANTVARYETALRTQPIKMITTLVFRDFDAPRAFAIASGFEFRRIVPDDYRALGRVSDEPQFEILRPPFVPSSLDWICSITEYVNQPSEIRIPTAAIQRMLAALALLKRGRADVHLVGTDLDGFYVKSGQLSNSQPLFTSRFAGRFFLDEADLQPLTEYYKRLVAVDEDDRLKYQRVSVRRLRLASGRDAMEDVLVDLVVGLEALLAPDTNVAETTYRFRLRGAAILKGKISGAGADRIKLLNRLYAARSTAVHGGEVSDLKELVDTADQALRAAILWFLFHPHAVSGAVEIVKAVDAKMVDSKETPDATSPAGDA